MSVKSAIRLLLDWNDMSLRAVSRCRIARSCEDVGDDETAKKVLSSVAVELPEGRREQFLAEIERSA